MKDRQRWSDLAPRVLSGAAMAVIGFALVWAGGWFLALAVAVLCGLMVWEAARMFGAGDAAALRLGFLGMAALVVAWLAPAIAVLPVLLAAAAVGAGQVGKDRYLFAAFAGWILLGAFGTLLLRERAGLDWILWLILVVILSDILGYFAGRMLGGPKFWPRISPKKTWSGTIAGWIGAAVIGLVFAVPTGAGLALVPVSVLVGFAGQMGDIFESALKRRQGVKDSSALIPGHGGVLDRFDAMLGAAILAIVLWMVGLLPGVA